MPPADPDAFIAHWSDADASELSTAQSFLNDLIDLIGADRPDPSHAHGYCFEYPVTFPRTGTTGFIDLYKRGCFVLEAKQGSLRRAPTRRSSRSSPSRRHPRGTAVRGTRPGTTP